ncbi:MAG TPA: dienelactone hydrolase [Rhodobacteraceae bacterium]|jgi:dienelactone hydrolase|nr:dienelactone hydrolase [Paracoccaceae bacterium]
MTFRPILMAALLAAALPASAEITGAPFDYTVGDTVYEGYVARNTAAEPRGTVLIIHDWDGLGDYEMRRAEMLAAMGYTAVAADLYGKDVEPTTTDEYRALTGALYGDRDEFRTRLMGSLMAARALDGATEEVVAIGYCFGGAAVLEMARAGADLSGVVSFHGGLTTPEGQDYSQTTAPVLVLHGSADPVSGMADLAALLDQLQAAGVEHDAQVFGGARHSFTVFGSRDYDIDAEQGSWQALTAFLGDQL